MSLKRDKDRDTGLRAMLRSPLDHIMRPCLDCRGSGMALTPEGRLRAVFCPACDGRAFIGGRSLTASPYMPGDARKVALLADRYERGQPLWRDDDAWGVEQPYVDFGEDEDFDDWEDEEQC